MIYNLNMEKLERMKEHLKENPKDYQTAISYLKENSRQITKRRKNAQNEMLKKIAFYKRGASNGK